MIMAKWKCEICGSKFDNFHAQGFDNKIYCPLCYFKKLSIDYEQRIDKAIEHSHNQLGFLENCVGGDTNQINREINIHNYYLSILKGEDVK